MSHADSRHLFHVLGIPSCALLAQALALPDHDQDRGALDHGGRGGHDEGVLVAQVLDPGRDPVADGEAHRVPDQDDGDDGLAAQRAVRLDAVVAHALDGDSARARDDEGGEDGAEPVDPPAGPDAPEDQAERQQDDRRGEEPEAVLALEDAAPPAGHGQGDPVAPDAGVGGADKHPQQGRDVGHADHAGAEPVGPGEDERRGGVEHVEPHQAGPVVEAAEHDDGEAQVDQGPLHHAPEVVFLPQVLLLPELKLGQVRLGFLLPSLSLLLVLRHHSLVELGGVDRADVVGAGHCGFLGFFRRRLDRRAFKALFFLLDRDGGHRGLNVEPDKVGLLHEEEQEDKHNGAEDGAPVLLKILFCQQNGKM